MSDAAENNDLSGNKATGEKPGARITGTRRVYDGFFKMDELTIEVDRHAGGTDTITRLNFERGHAVSILAYDPETDQVILVNEMRTGMLAAGDDPFSDALPAGMIDKGEDALTAARREMLEETGLTLENTEVIHKGAFVSPGGTSEKISLIFGTVSAKAAGGIHGKPGEGEDIKTVLLSSDDFIARVQSGAISDLKTVACAFWLAANRDRLRKEKAAPKTPPAPQLKP